MRHESIIWAFVGFMLLLQNHDVTKPDAQQTFRLMHYFSVEGKEFPEDFPRVRHLLHDIHHIVYHPSQLLYCCAHFVASQLVQARAMQHVIVACERALTKSV